MSVFVLFYRTSVKIAIYDTIYTVNTQSISLYLSLSLSIKLASIPPNHAHSRVAMLQYQIRVKGGTRQCPVNVLSV